MSKFIGTYSLSTLANLVLKAQNELQEVLSSMGEKVPSEIGLSIGKTAVKSSWATGEGVERSFNLVVTENGIEYNIQVPCANSPSNGLKVRLVFPNGSSEEIVFSGVNTITESLPPAFREVHGKVLKYLDAYFGKEWLKNRQVLKDPHTKKIHPAEEKEVSSEAAASTKESPPSAPTQETVNEYQWYVVRRANQKDLKFKGRTLATGRTAFRQGRQYVLSVFETPSGKIVAIKEGLTMWLNERDITDVGIFESIQELPGFFGYGALAKAIYLKIGLTESTEEVIE